MKNGVAPLSHISFFILHFSFAMENEKWAFILHFRFSISGGKWKMEYESAFSIFH